MLGSSKKSLRSFVTTATIGSILLVCGTATAQAQEHQYNAQLIQRYTTGCRDQLIKKGYSAGQATSLCSCSIKQMQQNHSQSSAIVLLTSAQLNPIKDPRLGLPNTLSKFFTPCFVQATH